MSRTVYHGSFSDDEVLTIEGFASRINRGTDAAIRLLHDLGIEPYRPRGEGRSGVGFVSGYQFRMAIEQGAAQQCLPNDDPD